MVLVSLSLVGLVLAGDAVRTTILESETTWEVNLAIRLANVVVALSVVPWVTLASSIRSSVTVTVVLF